MSAGVPYDLSPAFIHELFHKHKIDYILHGDDPCLLPDGSDAYAHAKRLGRFRMVGQWQPLIEVALELDRIGDSFTNLYKPSDVPCLILSWLGPEHIRLESAWN